MKKKYPKQVCIDCGLEASGGYATGLNKTKFDFCDVCLQLRRVTHPKEYYYPYFNGFEPYKSKKKV